MLLSIASLDVSFDAKSIYRYVKEFLEDVPYATIRRHVLKFGLAFRSQSAPTAVLAYPARSHQDKQIYISP